MYGQSQNLNPIGFSCSQFPDCWALDTLYEPIPAEFIPQTTPYINGFDGAQASFMNSDFSYLLTPLFAYVVPVVVQFILMIMDLIIGVVAAQQLATMLGGKIRLGIGNIKLT